MKTLTRHEKKLEAHIHTTATEIMWMITDQRLDEVKIARHHLVITTEWHEYRLDLDADFYYDFTDPIFRYHYETQLLKLLKTKRRTRRRFKRRR